MQPVDKKGKIHIEDEDDGRQGGQSGAVEFHDFLNLNGIPLNAEEERLKLLELKGKNSGLVDRQRESREQYQKMRDQEKSAGNQQGLSSREEYGYELHPITSRAAEFSTDSRQVNMSVEDSKLETNSEKKQELTYQHQHRLQLQNERRFVPPTPRMS
jgi:hypothetical protein